MKRFLLFFGVTVLSLLLTLVLISCGCETTSRLADTTTVTEAETTANVRDTTPATVHTVGDAVPDFVDRKRCIVQDGKTNYKVTFAQGANKNADTGVAFSDALSTLRKAFERYGVQSVSIMDDKIPLDEKDSFAVPEYEILIGNTNREESAAVADQLAFNQAAICVVGKKIVIVSQNDLVTAKAVLVFIETYMPEGGKAVLVPLDLDTVVTLDLSESEKNGMRYAEMAEMVWDSFKRVYENGKVESSVFQEDIGLLEVYIDVYEHTRDAEDRVEMLACARRFLQNYSGDWQYNECNDEVIGACVAFARIAQLTGDVTYAQYAKQNWEAVWNRAWDTELGGGLYWRADHQTKNSCVNCSATIAACLLGDVYDNESYFAMARQIMAWEIDLLFDKSSGKVYHACSVAGALEHLAYTYNQGVFIGACTLLYQHYGEATYLTYAEKAVSFVMTEMTQDGILNHREDAIGNILDFKGILVRWLYRYAKETESLEMLAFLQKNADTAFQNRNQDGLIWSEWCETTPNDATQNENYRPFSMSAAVVLMYNCMQWW